ncbi:hypothetical protein PFISCL1PPCAC_18799, partial [Pristionchus fissidentatus]
PDLSEHFGRILLRVSRSDLDIVRSLRFVPHNVLYPRLRLGGKHPKLYALSAGRVGGRGHIVSQSHHTQSLLSNTQVRRVVHHHL